MSSSTNSNGVTYNYSAIPSVTTPGAITISDGTTATTYSVPLNLTTPYVQTTNGTVGVLGLTSQTFFDVPGAAVTYDLAIALLGTTTFHIGGTGTINAGVAGLTGIIIDSDGGAATFTDLAGVATAFTANIADHGTLTIGTGLLGLLNGSTINYGTNGGTLILSAASPAVINLSGLTINGLGAGPASNGVDFLENQAITYASVGSYTVTTGTGTQTETFFSGANGTGTNLGSITTAGAGLKTGTFAANDASGALKLTSVNGYLDITSNTCFLRGTLIATPDGSVTIETLAPGALVSTLVDGEIVPAPVRWVGNRQVRVAQYGNHIDMFPVRIRANAVRDGAPAADLLVTSEHCLFIDGKLIPARMLVNGSSIVIDTSITAYEYFHVELDRHAILIAEGLETESYLDTGNRANFANSDVTNLHPNFVIDADHKSWETHAAAPLATDRETVEPIWGALCARAAALGLDAPLPAVIDREPDLRVLTANGRMLTPTSVDGTFYTFTVPADAGALRLVSRTFRPADAIGPFVDDRRTLGVFVGEIGLTVDGQHCNVSAHLVEAELAGWHAAEGTGRWTSGDAILPVDLSTTQGPVTLKIEVVTPGLYRSASAAALLAA